MHHPLCKYESDLAELFEGVFAKTGRGKGLISESEFWRRRRIRWRRRRQLAERILLIEAQVLPCLKVPYDTAVKAEARELEELLHADRSIGIHG